MATDGELLRLYSETHSEEAFAELVQRYIDLVFSAALRQVNGDAHLAQDVAQTVFTDLARKASQLSRREILTGWLYTSTHFAASKAVRSERRRRQHEQEAQAMHELLQTPAPDVSWDRIHPILDAVMLELNETDRETILLRYFEKRQLADIGEKLGLSEDTARKRVDRALEKLRGFLSKRGITATAALATTISSNAIQTAPAGMAATLTTASLAGAAGTGTVLSALKLMTITKLHATVAGAILTAGIAVPLVLHHQAELRNENNSLRSQLNQLSALKAENERLAGLVAQASNSPSLPQEQFGELLRLRNEVGALRHQTNALARMVADNQRLKPPQRPADAVAEPFDGLKREAWVFAGYADPESALQSAIWARDSGNVGVYMESIAPDGSEFREYSSRPEVEVAGELPRETRDINGYKVIDREMVSDNDVILTVLAAGSDGKRDEAFFQMRRYGNEWKLVGVDKSRKGNLTKQSAPVQAAGQ